MAPRDGVDVPPLLDDLNTGVILHDVETGEILAANSRIVDLYGYSRQQLQELTVEDLTPPSTKFTREKAISRIHSAADGDSQSFE